MTEPHSAEGNDTEEFEMNASSPQQLPAEPFDDYDDGFDEVLPQRPRAQLPDAAHRAADGADPGRRRLLRRDPRREGSGREHRQRRLRVRAVDSQALSGLGRQGRQHLARSGLPELDQRPRRRGLPARSAAPEAAPSARSRASTATPIYVKETSGNTVKVKLSSATKISKSESVSRKKLYPGDQVVVAGSAASNGTVHATSVTDSGASSTGSSSASSSSSTGSTSNTSSAIRSLFGGG